MQKQIQFPKAGGKANTMKMKISQDAEWELPGNSGFYNFQDMWVHFLAFSRTWVHFFQDMWGHLFNLFQDFFTLLA